MPDPFTIWIAGIVVVGLTLAIMFGVTDGLPEAEEGALFVILTVLWPLTVLVALVVGAWVGLYLAARQLTERAKREQRQ